MQYPEGHEDAMKLKAKEKAEKEAAKGDNVRYKLFIII